MSVPKRSDDELPDFLKGLPYKRVVAGAAKTREESLDPDVVYGIDSMEKLSEFVREWRAARSEKK